VAPTFFKFGAKRDLTMNVKLKTKPKAKSATSTQKTFKEFGFVWPDFNSPEAAHKWLNSLPRENAEVEPRLKKRLPVELTLHQYMIEGFEYLASSQA
jgi:hypothetical protein